MFCLLPLLSQCCCFTWSDTYSSLASGRLAAHLCHVLGHICWCYPALLPCLLGVERLGVKEGELWLLLLVAMGYLYLELLRRLISRDKSEVARHSTLFFIETNLCFHLCEYETYTIGATRNYNVSKITFLCTWISQKLNEDTCWRMNSLKSWDPLSLSIQEKLTPPNMYYWLILKTGRFPNFINFQSHYFAMWFCPL